MLDDDVFGNLEKNSTRSGLGKGLLELGEKNNDVVVLTADLCESTQTNLFKEKFPNRFFECGVAEANMISIAAGLASVGKIPFATTFGVFAPGRNLDQIRVSVCYSDFNVKIASTHCGLNTGEDGASHQATEDIALMRSMPNMKVVVPCDFVEAKKATIAAGTIKGPFYLRYGRNKIPIITNDDTPFKIGKAEVFKKGKDVTIIACGLHVYEALVAAKQLEKDKIDAQVINCHTIKPIDKDTIIKAAKQTGAIVTAEDHQIIGGLGSAIAEVVVDKYPIPIKMVGIKDRFGTSGNPDELMVEYGLTSSDIVNAVYEVLKMK